MQAVFDVVIPYIVLASKFGFFFGMSWTVICFVIRAASGRDWFGSKGGLLCFLTRNSVI